MTEKFELRTRHQFAALMERRDRWVRIRNEPEARARFEHLAGPEWARQNLGLEARSDDALWQAETLDPSRLVQLQSHIASARTLLSLGQQKQFLTRDDLLELHRVLCSAFHPSAGEFRQREGTPLSQEHQPTEPDLIAPLIDNALTWFQSDSFAEMHEIEKSALMLIKLLDIQPFEECNGPSLRLFSTFAMLKAGYPPTVIPAGRTNEYALAVQRSFRFDTQPIIDVIAEAADWSLRWCLGDPPAPPMLKVLPS